jgi:hypothetical protein
MELEKVRTENETTLQNRQQENELKKISFQEGEKRKTGLLESLTKGEVREVPNRQVSNVMGKPVFESQTVQEQDQNEPGIFSGTPFGVLGRYKSAPKSKSNISDTVKTWAWNEYKNGNRSPDVLKILGAFVPSERIGVSSQPTSISEAPQASFTKPAYDPKTQKLQQNLKTGEYRVVPK